MTSPLPREDPRHALGRQGEQLALEHLQRLDYQLVARNHRTRFGEIDLIVRNERALVFVEVKTRRASRRGAVWDSLGPRKRRQVRDMARAYLHETGTRPWTDELRFDAIGVAIDGHGALVRLDHLEDAF